MKKIFIVAMLFFIDGLLMAAEPPPPEELTQMTGKFFELLKKDKIEQAYDELLKNSKIKAKKEDVTQLKEQTREALLLLDRYSALNCWNTNGRDSVSCSSSTFRGRRNGLCAGVSHSTARRTNGDWSTSSLMIRLLNFLTPTQQPAPTIQ